jgi:hypothetical protein
MKENKRKLLLDWMRKIHTLEHAHRLESIKWDKVNNLLGIPSLIIAALIGAFGSICEFKDNLIVNIFSTLGAVSVAILAGIQTFLKPTEFGEKHRSASNIYEKFRHKIEYILEFKSDQEIDANIEAIRLEWNQIDSINISNKNFMKAKDWIKGMKKYPEELGFLETIP